MAAVVARTRRRPPCLPTDPHIALGLAGSERPAHDATGSALTPLHHQGDTIHHNGTGMTRAGLQWTHSLLPPRRTYTTG